MTGATAGLADETVARCDAVCRSVRAVTPAGAELLVLLSAPALPICVTTLDLDVSVPVEDAVDRVDRLTEGARLCLDEPDAELISGVLGPLSRIRGLLCDEEAALETDFPVKGVIIVVRLDVDLLKGELEGLAICTDLLTGGEYRGTELTGRDGLGRDDATGGLDTVAGGDEGLDTDGVLLGALDGAGLGAGTGLGRETAVGRLGARAGTGDGALAGARAAAGGGEGRAAG